MNRWWLRLSAYARPLWSSLVALLILDIARVALDALEPWPMKLIVDSVLGSAPPPPVVVRFLPGAVDRGRLLLAMTVGILLLFAASWTLRVWVSYIQTGTANRMIYALASDLFDHLQRLSLRFHGRRPTGDLVKRVTADTGCARELVIDVAMPLLTAVASLLIMFGIMWRLDPVLSVVAIVAAPLLGISIKKAAPLMLMRAEELYERQGEVMAMAEQTLSALPVVRVFGQEAYEDARFSESSRRADRAYLRNIKTQQWFKLSVDTVTALGTAAVIAVGGYHAVHGRISVGSLLVFINYLAALYSPIETLAYLSTSLASASAGARRVFDLLDTREHIVEIPGARAISDAAGEIRFEHVTAGYDGGRPVLHDIDFTAGAGEMMAIVGETGAGKTTLVSLIPRLLDPQAGRVLLDEVPLTELKLRSLRAQVGVVLQDAFILPLTVAENIAYSRPGAGRAEIAAAAEAAQAAGFIERLPKGYETVLGERGATLSGGERQRIAIARAILKNAPILILDEPTAALDSETERALMSALQGLMQGRTTFVIAHRLSTVRRANKVLVVHQGRIVESGKHEALLQANGLYAQLHAIQFQPEIVRGMAG